MQPVDFRFTRPRQSPKATDDAPQPTAETIRPSQEPDGFDVVTGLGAGPSLPDVAAAGDAGADEVARLREENGDRAERHKALLADMEAMSGTRLRQGEKPIPTDELPDGHHLGPGP